VVTLVGDAWGTGCALENNTESAKMFPGLWGEQRGLSGDRIRWGAAVFRIGAVRRAQAIPGCCKTGTAQCMPCGTRSPA